MTRRPFYQYLLYIALLFGVVLFTAILITYPRFRKQMNAAKERIHSQSLILDTKFGLMEYAVQGAGKPVLLIHGAGGGFDQGLWLGQVCLKEDFMFIAPSKFGYLNSQVPKEFSAKHQAKQYKILLDYLNVDKALVVAVSAGGPSAMQFAADYPEMVEKLVLVSAVSMPPNPNDKAPFFIKIIQLIQRSDYAYWLFTKIFERQILSLFGIPSEEYKNYTPQQKALAEELLKVMHPMSLRYHGTLVDGLIIEKFLIPKGITAPTLIIHSRNDGLVSYSHGEFVHEHINDSRLILYDKGGHGAISELEDMQQQIQLFLDDNGQ